MIHIIPLSLLAAGQRAEVMVVAGQPDHARRLNELGFRQGVEVEMLRCGKPCIVRLENTKMCFRDSDVSHVMVRAGAPA